MRPLYLLDCQFFSRFVLITVHKTQIFKGSYKSSIAISAILLYLKLTAGIMQQLTDTASQFYIIGMIKHAFITLTMYCGVILVISST